MSLERKPITQSSFFPSPPSPLPPSNSDNYTYSPFPPLPFRLICFAGAEDARADKGIMEGWKKFTSHVEEFAVEVFPGGHFFIKEHTSLVLERLGKRVGALG